MSIERPDTAYVGVIESQKFALVYAKYEGWSAIEGYPYTQYYKYQVPCVVNNTTTSPFRISGEPIYAGLSGNVNSPFRPVYFTARSSGSGWIFQVFNESNQPIGYLNLDSTNTLVISNTGRAINMIPNEPAGYGRINGSARLLAGVVYSMNISSVDSFGIIFQNDISVYSPPEYDGLLTAGDPNMFHRSTSSGDPWIIIPIEGIEYLSADPIQIGTVPPPIRVSQCLALGADTNPGSRHDYGYAASSNCTNWSENRGFATEADVEDFIYFYSQSGECGQAYQYSLRNKTGTVQVASSRGDDCENCPAEDIALNRGCCDFSEGIFSCTEDEGGDDDTTDEDSRTLIMFLIAVVILIILVLVIVGVGYYLLKKSGTNSPDNVQVITV